MLTNAVAYQVGSYPEGLAAADVNNDSKPDLVTANYNGSSATVLLGNGNGTFQPLMAYGTEAASSYAIDVVVADVNGDGRPDLLTANYAGSSASVLRGNGNGTFQAAATYSTGPGGGPIRLLAADLNGDARPDLLVTNTASNTVAVLLNTTVLASVATQLPPGEAQLYPNPARGSLRVLVPGIDGASTAQAELLNSLGQLVLGQRVALPADGTTLRFDTSKLPVGVYLLRLSGLDAQGTTRGTLPTQRLRVE